MTTTSTQKIILFISGSTAIGIGAAILAVPIAFHASNGIALGDNTSLLSEIRAPGGALLTMGLIMLAGLLRPRLAGYSLGVGAAVFLSYGLSRWFAIALDGWPEPGLVAAAVIELVIGASCVFGLLGRRPAPRAMRPPADGLRPASSAPVAPTAGPTGAAGPVAQALASRQ